MDDDDRQAFEFAYASYLARQVDREVAQMIAEAAEAAEAGVIRVEQATEALNYLTGTEPNL